MSQQPDIAPASRLSSKDAERACRELSDQIERVRDLVEQYRVTLAQRSADNDASKH